MTPTVDNVLRTYANASFFALSTGMTWYDDAHAFARALGGNRFHRAAGVISALSPLNEWDNNKRKAAALYAANGVVHWNGTANGYGLAASVRKAVRIYNGEDALDVFSAVTARKTRAFFMTIVNPACQDTDPVIDRHAFDLAIGERTNDAARGVLSRKGEYERFADTYREAASLVGIGTAQLQAVTWVAWKQEHGIFI